jgi:hypothetical protein
MSGTMEAVSSFLFEQEEGNVYAILDGASVPGLLEKLRAQPPPEYECLYRGEPTPDIAEVAPYLVRLKADTPFTEWVLREGWGKHWGVFAVTTADLLAARLHFRRFLRVYDPDGKPLYFRYYDPRVLRVYLPTCNASELSAFFGPVAAFVLEDEQPGTALRFRNEGGKLARRAQNVGQAVPPARAG